MKPRNRAANQAVRRYRLETSQRLYKAGFTQGEIADVLGVDRATVNYYLSARCKTRAIDREVANA
jgi:predicted transcriptional regulator